MMVVVMLVDVQVLTLLERMPTWTTETKSTGAWRARSLGCWLQYNIYNG